MDIDNGYMDNQQRVPQAPGARPLVDPEALGEVDPTRWEIFLFIHAYVMH